MIAAAERLGQGHYFVRVDFYEVEGRALFGEFCLFPGSGLDPFDPPAIDEWLSDQWSAQYVAARAPSLVQTIQLTD